MVSTPLSDRISPTYNAGPSEPNYCSGSITHSNPITITGIARYQAREPYYISAFNSGLGGAGAAKPIRRAEVRVTNSSGSVVQCAETAMDGSFSLSLPNSGQTYTVSVNSRSYNSDLRASVLNRPEKNEFYSLSTSVVANSSKDIGTMTATVTGEILGAAFNILDQMLAANIYLRSQVSNCSAAITGCQNFTVAPKAVAFWEKGFNPASYFNEGPLSFYIPGYSRLFILGGVNGDVDNADTDHFDNSIIIHEYGHFLEDVIFGSDSPGGAHYGNDIIDPRLAWSEGFGNFLQAAVQDDPYYIDTSGNSDGSTQMIFYVNLENGTLDTPQALGEGNFREFSVTRLLWDAIDNTPAEATMNGATDNVNGGFPEIWGSLTKSTGGFLNPWSAFRDVGLFHLGQVRLQALDEGENWANLRTRERHYGDRREYAQLVQTGGGCAALSRTLTPAVTIGDNGSFATSDLLRNNDFFHYAATSAQGATTFKLNYLGSVVEADLDFYIYNENARYGNSADWVGYSRVRPDCNLATQQSETINLPSLPAGNYLIKVHAYTRVESGRCAPTSNPGGPVTYEIRMTTNNNEVLLCDSTISGY